MTITLRQPMLVPAIRILAMCLAIALALGAAIATVPILSRLGLLPATVANPWHNGLVAFERAGDIMAIDPSGADGPRVLIGGPETDVSPDWSPDGTRLAWWRTNLGVTSLMVADADGSHVTRLTSDPVVDPSTFWWSPDGASIVMLSRVGAASTISLVSADGSGVRELPLAVTPTDVSWHPDGRSLLVRAEGPTGAALYPVSLPAGTLGDPIARSDMTSSFFATDRGASDLRSATWSPDGSAIAYIQGQSPKDGQSGVFGGWDTRDHLLSGDGTTDRRLEYSPVSDYEDGAIWSPDGTRLLMVIRTGDEHQVAVATVDDSAPIVASPPRVDPGGLGVLWSPDGSTILAVRDADGGAYLVDAATGAETDLPWALGNFDWQPVR